jgi:hypothetical protein
VSRVLLPAAVAGLFLAILAALVVLFVRWAGSSAALVPMLRHPPALAMGLTSLATVVLAAWIAAARGPRRRRALAVGWLAAAPGLAVLAALAGEAAGVGLPAALDPILDPLVSVALLLPFSAGPLVFAVGFPLAMAARGAARLMRR